jgi:hypothetical protein|tara:strand:+ start:64 stop:222 length:159 start_codon:yes stop_codon:yes gene_type:complete
VRFSVNAAAVRDDSTRLDERDATRRDERDAPAAGRDAPRRDEWTTLFADTDF